MAGEGEAYRDKVKQLGAEIRQRREELGLSVDDVQRETRIRSKYLLAVEEGDESQAPGSTYYRAFLKTYATFLGLDGSRYSLAYQEIVDGQASGPAPGGDRPKPSRQAAERPAPARVPDREGPARPTAAPPTPGPASRPNADRPAKQASVAATVASPATAAPPRPHRPARRRRSSATALWGFLLLFAVALISYYAVSRYNAGKAANTEPPVSIAPPETTTPPVTEPETEPPEPEAKVTRTDVDSETVDITIDRTPLELSIKTTQDTDSYCWLRITVDGNIIAEKTLGPGQEEKVSANSEIVLRAGKPWVITLTLNGKDLGVAGEFGPVKDITLRSVTD